MVQCPFCGKELETQKTPKFCTYCGSNLASSVQKQIPPTQRMSVKKLSPSYRPWLIIIGGIVIICVIFISIILIGSFFLVSLFGPPLGSGIEIHSDADFIKYSTSGTGTIDDPYILSNYTLTGQFYSFSIHNTTKHFVITKCTIEICYEGINIENVAPGTAKIFGNNITYNDCRVWETGPHAGITIFSSPEVNISNNLISEAGYEGIVIVNSKKCFLSNNIISGHHRGIILDFSDLSIIKNNFLFHNSEAICCTNSHFSNIIDNTCVDNEDVCINIGGSNFSRISNNICVNNTATWPGWYSSGIILDTCNNCTITNCTISKCYQGIYTLGSAYCQIFNNSITNNLAYGINILSAYEIAISNTIFHNSFIENNPNGFSQASDNGTSNYWYNLELQQGNYWSDWNGTGFYTIAGIANTSDIYPLAEPPV
ncbi:MAG: nitrous oxide reductase family maturation protein NosD [Promethearchaeota archaeon]